MTSPRFWVVLLDRSGLTKSDPSEVVDELRSRGLGLIRSDLFEVDMKSHGGKDLG